MKYITVCLDDQEVEMGVKTRPLLSSMYNRSFTKKQLLALYAEMKMTLNENERRVHAPGTPTVKIRIPISNRSRTPLLHKIQKDYLRRERIATRNEFLFVVGIIFVAIAVWKIF